MLLHPIRLLWSKIADRPVIERRFGRLVADIHTVSRASCPICSFDAVHVGCIASPNAPLDSAGPKGGPIPKGQEKNTYTAGYRDFYKFDPWSLNRFTHDTSAGAA